MPTWSLSDTAKIALKVFLLFAFVVILKNFLLFLKDEFTAIYTNISTALSHFISSSLPDLLGGLLHVLGIDVFINSAFAILFSAGAFWLIAVGSIFAFKMSVKIYNSAFKALT